MFRAAFYKGTRPGLPGLFNRFVRFWDRGQYSHMELVFNDGLSASSSFLESGVRFKKIDFDPTRWDFIDLPDERESAARAWFSAHAGKAYDYWADIRFMYGFAPSSKDKWMCSEACMEALGFKEAWRFSPNICKAVLAFSLND
jgi:hypothetical protein